MAKQRSIIPNVESTSTANTFASLQANGKTQFPTASVRRKRFAKIRDKITGKR